jgi:glucose/mannose transport system substrate-binding protein
VFKAALMNLEEDALRGPEVLAAFEQTRKLSNWLDPNVGNQHWSVYIPKFLEGSAGMMLAGGAAQGIFRSAGGTLDDYVTSAGPQDNGNKGFVLNADSFIFWQTDDEDTTAGQKLLAELAMSKEACRLAVNCKNAPVRHRFGIKS